MSEFDAALVLLSMKDNIDSFSHGFNGPLSSVPSSSSSHYNFSHASGTGGTSGPTAATNRASMLDAWYRETNSHNSNGMLNSPGNSPPMKLGHGFSPVKPTTALYTTATGSAAIKSDTYSAGISSSIGANLDRYHYSNDKSGIVSPTPLSPDPSGTSQCAQLAGSGFSSNNSPQHSKATNTNTNTKREPSPDSQYSMLPLSPTSPNTNVNSSSTMGGSGHITSSMGSTSSNTIVMNESNMKSSPTVPRSSKGRSISPIHKSASHHRYTLPKSSSSSSNTNAAGTSSLAPLPYPKGGTRHIINVISTGCKKPFACDDCGRAFARREHLYRHVETMHNGQKDFKCQLCTRVFSRKDNMMQHVRNKHTKKNGGMSGGADMVSSP